MTVSPATITVVDEQSPRRIRNSLDGIRLVLLTAAIVVITGFATIASSTTRGANQDLKRGVDHLPGRLVNSLSFGGGIGAVAATIALIVRAITRGQRRRLADSLGAAV